MNRILVTLVVLVFSGYVQANDAIVCDALHLPAEQEFAITFIGSDKAEVQASGIRIPYSARVEKTDVLYDIYGENLEGKIVLHLQFSRFTGKGYVYWVLTSTGHRSDVICRRMETKF